MIWLLSAGVSLPWLLRQDVDDGEGQEEHAGCASDHQAQEAAVHLHGLTAVPRVKEGLAGDAPRGTGHGRSVGATRASSGAAPRAWPRSRLCMSRYNLVTTLGGGSYSQALLIILIIILIVLLSLFLLSCPCRKG